MMIGRQPAGMMEVRCARKRRCTCALFSRDWGCTSSYKVRLRPSTTTLARNRCQRWLRVKSDQSTTTSSLGTSRNQQSARRRYSSIRNWRTPSLPSSRSTLLRRCRKVMPPPRFSAMADKLATPPRSSPVVALSNAFLRFS